jgi:putative membrane-bound dehydrogenase-like protein
MRSTPPSTKLYALFITTVLSVAFSCNTGPKIPKVDPEVVVLDSVTAREKAAMAKQNKSIRLAEGLQLSLWASDSLAPDPIAIDIDDRGRIYLTRSNRNKNSEFDIRGHRDWMTPSISLQTVEERRAFLRETFAPEKSEENSWFPDLNNDTIHDWHDLTVEKEEIWMLEDTDENGIADKSTRILEDFGEEVTDVAGGLLVRDDEIFVGVGPDLWRVTDSNNDLVMDTKTSIATGFAVHIGFGGHGMSGVVQGPDGKIYWGIGDIGASITTVDGEKHHYPNQGVIVRSNPDGSDFEVFARGLRNTHEFVFDAFGNIISSDNDGDHRGESERLVHIVEGSDAGWRSNWQYGKYTDENNNGYNVWMDEKLYVPRWEGQAAYIIPPITNYHNGPTGMAYNPGTALGRDWLNKFFLVEFVGDPSLSHIWSFSLEPSGASFSLGSETDLLSGILPTGLRFGPDGALYLADWINGWGSKDAGRIWRIDVDPSKNDLEGERKETRRLMTLDYSDQSTDELIVLLSYPDKRIRQKAQFELARSTFWGYRALKEVLAGASDQMARIHAIWAIGQMAASNKRKAEPLMELLDDSDPEIVAQAAKILGDVRYEEAAGKIVPLLKHENARVRFFAAQALGRMAYKEAETPLLELLASNDDEDIYIRHAGVLALSRISDAGSMVALAENPDQSLRLAAVLVLRKLNDPGIAVFLSDEDEFIVTEAARAINDDWSIEGALPALATSLQENRFTSEPLLRRAINAALRVGGEAELGYLINFAKDRQRPAALRGEALAALGTWASPSVLDRVDGRYRGEVKREVEPVIQAIEKDIPVFLSDTNAEILSGIAKTIGLLGIKSYNDALFQIFRSHRSPEVKAAMMQSLANLNAPQIGQVIEQGMRDNNPDVRATAVGLVGKLDISKEALPRMVNPIFSTGSTAEQQTMLVVLGEMPLEKSEGVLKGLIDRAGKNQLRQEVILDLIEAIEASGSEALQSGLQQLKKSGYTTDSYQETLYGGRWWQGRSVFNNNPTAQCVRCHSVDGAGGKVGPPMDNIGNLLSREQILESLIEPSARIAPGYGNVTLTLKDGQVVSGLLKEETSEFLLLGTSEAEPMEIPVSRIARRENAMSGMPAMGRLISRRELRDLIQYLSSLKE